MLFDLAVDELEGWMVVTVVGELDLASAPRLRQEVTSLAGKGRCWVLIDMTDVDFLDSTGLGVLVGILKRLRSLGGDLRLVGTRPAVRRVFDLTGLDRVLPLHPSVSDALAAERVDG